MLGLAKGSGTNNPHLAAILMAQRINRLCAGAIVEPWRVEQLDETWLDAFAALDTQLPRMREGISRIEARKAEIRAGAMKRRR
mgnify:CR=1 FL=1